MFQEEGLETRPTPTLVSSNSGPVVVFCGLSAHVHHIVDGTGAAKCFTARKGMDSIVGARLFICQKSLIMTLNLEIVLPAVQFSTASRNSHGQLDWETQPE